jgi:hypothetical protein
MWHPESLAAGRAVLVGRSGAAFEGRPAAVKPGYMTAVLEPQLARRSVLIGSELDAPYEGQACKPELV